MDLATRLVWTAMGCAFAAACSRGTRAPEPLTIERTSPDLGEHAPPLLLNDALTVYFSSEIMPLSVTSDSVTVIDENGHQVPGTLRVGANWVTFQPEPPLSPALDDGSFRPGSTCRLLVAGLPRPDGVRAADGRRLAAAATFVVRVAGLADAPAGLPAPLRPPAAGLPLVLPPQDGPQPLPADAPRLQLHFTQPLLPASVVPDAFEVTLLRQAQLEELVPRSVRVVTSRLDQVPGSTVEIDLGTRPHRRDGRAAPLADRDLIGITLRRGGPALLDYSGNPALAATPHWWSVVAGTGIAIAEWPVVGEDVFVADDPLMPAFEVRGGAIRPRVRVEAGDGSLGVFRPQRDTTLRPGLPFDRGDGQVVTSRGADFPFLAVEIPDGVTVRVDASAGPVRILACGSVRVAGALELDCVPQPLPVRRSQPVRELADAAPIAVVAAGDVEVAGRVRAAAPPAPDTTCLLLATAGHLRLRGALPFQTMLAVESDGENTIDGPRGQSILFVTSFTYGLAPGADVPVRGCLPWRMLPPDRDGGVLRVFDASPELQMSWQSAPPHAVRKGEPDLGVGRVARLERAADGAPIVTQAGAFVRVVLSARARDGEPLPRVDMVRLADR